MKGKILFCSTKDVFDLDLDKYQIKLQITRYTKKGILTGFTHTPSLAPSEKLLNKTNNKWKKLVFTDEERLEMKNGKTHTWWDLYTDEFINETKTRQDYILAYNELKKNLDEGRNIIACCYCMDPDKCHRSLEAKALKDEGYNVELL
jgi:exonuclease III